MNCVKGCFVIGNIKKGKQMSNIKNKCKGFVAIVKSADFYMGALLQKGSSRDSTESHFRWT
jgi:hypothetical protein